MKVLLAWLRNPENHGVSESTLLECALAYTYNFFSTMIP